MDGSHGGGYLHRPVCIETFVGLLTIFGWRGGTNNNNMCLLIHCNPVEPMHLRSLVHTIRLVLIYLYFICSHGSEDKLVTLMGVLQALVSVVQDNNDALRCMRAGNHQFVFLVREDLTLVAVVQDPCHFIQHILVELNYVYNQVVIMTENTSYCQKKSNIWRDNMPFHNPILINFI